ncbi:MAG: hypothetical protein RL060_1059, partial [Bacteroidota bacterium]
MDQNADLLAKSKEELIAQIIALQSKIQDSNYHIHAVKPDIKNDELIALLEENSHDLVIVHDLEGNIIGYNRASADFLSDEIKTMYHFIVPEFRNEFGDYLIRIINKGFDKGFIKVLDKNGTQRLLNYSNKLVINSAGEKIIHSIGHDITEIWNTNKNLKAAKLSYKGLFNASSEAIFILNTHGELLDLNETAMLQYGFSLEETKGKSVFELDFIQSSSSIELQKQFDKIIERVLAGYPQIAEFLIKEDNDLGYSSHEISFKKGVYFNDEVIIMYDLDITERKLQEERNLKKVMFQESQKRLEEIFEKVRMIGVTIDS